MILKLKDKVNNNDLSNEITHQNADLRKTFENLKYKIFKANAKTQKAVILKERKPNKNSRLSVCCSSVN